MVDTQLVPMIIGYDGFIVVLLYFEQGVKAFPRAGHRTWGTMHMCYKSEAPLEAIGGCTTIV